MDSNLLPPYGDIIHGVLLGIMRGQAEVIKATNQSLDNGHALHWLINRHFAWLAIRLDEGKDRHLTSGYGSLGPLRTKTLRNKLVIAKKYPELNTFCGFPGIEIDEIPTDRAGFKGDPWNLASYEPTRISALIVDSVRSSPQKDSINIDHPLAVAFKYLTVPSLPATRAYAHVAVRTFVQAMLQNSEPPRGGLESDYPHYAFGVSAIEYAISKIRTSTTPRHNSKGHDTFGPSGGVDAIVRHLLAARDVLECYFPSKDRAISYLESNNPIQFESAFDREKYSFRKSDRLVSLPAASEVVNEILGIPLPIEGAETLFRGGLRTARNGSLVVALHGGPGSGKTSFALALCAYLAPLGIPSLYLTVEESRNDLFDRMLSLVPEELARLRCFPKDLGDLVTFEQTVERSKERHATSSNAGDSETEAMGPLLLDQLERKLLDIGAQLNSDDSDQSDKEAVNKPCKAIIVLDGVHDLFVESQFTDFSSTNAERLYNLVSLARKLRVLVVLTTGTALEGFSEVRLDHLVDVALHLTQNASDAVDTGQNRQITLTKARYQLCSPGTHSYNVASSRGVKIVPLTTSEIERRAIWKTQLPNKRVVRTALTRGANGDILDQLHQRPNHGLGKSAKSQELDRSLENAIPIFDQAHIFINGHGSGGKAALALKVALSRRQNAETLEDLTPTRQDRVLVVSFLYPEEYYDHIVGRLLTISGAENKVLRPRARSQVGLDVLHLRPGYLRPHELFQKIESRLTAAEISGVSHSAVILDGIHNVFLQFPEIEKYKLFWAQLYSYLRTKMVTTITTHATLALPHEGLIDASKIDDQRSEPLRQSLVLKTDYQIEVDPILLSPFVHKEVREELNPLSFSRYCSVKAVSAVESIPRGYLIWDRENFCFSDPPNCFTNHRPRQRNQGTLDI